MQSIRDWIQNILLHAVENIGIKTLHGESPQRFASSIAVHYIEYRIAPRLPPARAIRRRPHAAPRGESVALHGEKAGLAVRVGIMAPRGWMRALIAGKWSRADGGCQGWSVIHLAAAVVWLI